MEQMKQRIHRLRGFRSRRAFSLVELLAVIGLMLLMLSLAVRPIASLMESSRITDAGQLVVDQISLARQIASARNCPVEVRLIRMGSSSSACYDAIQLWSVQSTPSAMARLVPLPQNIAIVDNPAISGFFALSPVTSTMNVPSNASARYVAFQVAPSGLVTPKSAMSSLFFTVLASRYASASTLPSNYVIVQINPNTGSPSAFRP
jgi:uncharacterized protein (TIGR02596 family)